MIRVLWLFADPVEEPYVLEHFLPLVRQLSGGEQARCSRVLASAMGDFPARFVVELPFPSEDEMNEAFASAEGRQIAREIMEAAGKGMDMVTLEDAD